MSVRLSSESSQPPKTKETTNKLETLKGNTGNQTHNTNEQDTLKMKDLTTRQLQVLRYIAQGDTNKQIALKLCLSHETVRLHVYNLMKKLNARNRAHAVAIYDRIPRTRVASHLIRHLTTQDSRRTTTNPN